MAESLLKICDQFQFAGKIIDAGPYQRGHIHDSYVARFQGPDDVTQRYFLQRLNQQVFQNVGALMENIAKVTAHVRERIATEGGDPLRGTLTLIPTIEGKTLLTTKQGDCWRAYALIEGAQTYDLALSPDHVYHASRTIGNFQRMLRDFPVDELQETIPDFHHTPKRFQAFLEAVSQDRHNRARLAKAEIAFVEARAQQISTLVDLLERGELPLRVTHNDTKLNNVLIDEKTGAGLCLLDLDTVMPGLSVYDFGDAVRTGANPAAEDEPDASKAAIDLELFDRYARGYLEVTRDFLTPAEIDLLAFSARLMTLECGMRFLADFLNGDPYFKTQRADQNLDRCQVQFAMVRDIEAKYARMVRIVEGYK
jgi:Ser/Thr protein kinase RdoA (MazF antagonist)